MACLCCTLKALMSPMEIMPVGVVGIHDGQVPDSLRLHQRGDLVNVRQQAAAQP